MNNKIEPHLEAVEKALAIPRMKEAAEPNFVPPNSRSVGELIDEVIHTLQDQTERNHQIIDRLSKIKSAIQRAVGGP